MKYIKSTLFLTLTLCGCATVSSSEVSMMSDRELCETRSAIINYKPFSQDLQYSKQSKDLVFEEISKRGIASCDITKLVCQRELKLKPGTNEYTQCHLQVQKQEAEIAAQNEKLRMEKSQQWLNLQKTLEENNNINPAPSGNTQCTFFGNSMNCNSY